MIHTISLITLGLFLSVMSEAEEQNKTEDRSNNTSGIRPNILFISVDDLNDWVGCLGGHPQAKTPNIDALAQRGVLFEHAYCAAPLCSPSRTAVMTGLRPSTTGIYGNLNWFRDLPKYKNWVTLPQYFRKHGYKAFGGGKLFHQPKGKFSDPSSWDEQYSLGQGTPRPEPSRRYTHGLKEKFYYIQYNKGGEELYDMSDDSNQLHNLAEDSRYADTKEKLKKWIPKKNAPHFRYKK
jgi:hypothetical protein